MVGMIQSAQVLFNSDGTVEITGTLSYPTAEAFVMLIGANKNTAIINGVQNVTKDDPITSPITTTTTNFETTTETATTTTRQRTTLFPEFFPEITGGWTAADGTTYSIVDAEDGTVNIFALDASGKLKKYHTFLLKFFR